MSQTPPPRSGSLELGEINVRHLARELSSVRSDVAAVSARIVDHVQPSLSHLTTELGALKAFLMPEPVAIVITHKPPHVPWRLFLASLASAVLALAGNYLLHR